ncbi:HNH endonuclease [Burkholderia ambifaria]|uniref:HNH endonuclease n=1 Tax=Burkholderia ambifaria TaxID=152480 RepID=UPI001B8F5D9F|nr:HNH endonuclease signature motif containing protein [Burkholderia ambifaria]MBR8182106.1 HNH endonuclease [Burkholderia ambifaria]
MNVITRAEAKAAGLKRYFTGEPCKNGHISEFQVSSNGCCECNKIKKKAEYQENLEASRAARRTYYAANAERVREKNNRSRIKNCETVLAGKKAWYNRVKQTPEWQAQQKAKREANKEAKRAYDKQYAIANSAKKVERAKAWTKANPDKRAAITFSYDGRRRSQKEQGDSTAAIREWVKATKKVCYWCSAKCADDYHVDHYQPLSKGGEHRISNLVIACPTCNLRKNAKDPLEFAASMGRLF